MESNMYGGNQEGQDRIQALQQRIISLKQESRDMRFTAYLDRIWSEVKKAENQVGQLEEQLEQNYRMYQAQTAPPVPPVPPVPKPQFVAQPQTPPMVQQPQPRFVQQAPQPQVAQPRSVQPQMAQPQAMYQPRAQFVQQMAPQPQPGQQEQSMAPQPQPGQQEQSMASQPRPWVQYVSQQQYTSQQQQMPQQPYVPQQTVQYVQQHVPPMPQTPQGGNPQKSVEFKVGTVLLGIVGIAFLLVAFITFGLNYMSNMLQGIFLYFIGIVILASSELFFAKRVEKFSYCLTGLSISSLYITTLLNYIYLKVFPGWVALIVTVVITAFFFYLSRKKDSGMIRIICLIGCYISLMPMEQLKNQVEFMLPAIVIFLVNLAGVYCPVKKRRRAVDIIQYICSFSLIFYLIYLQWLSGLEMWPVFILVCGNVLTLHLLYFVSGEDAGYKVLYFMGQAVNAGCLLYICNHEYWLHYGVIGVVVLCAGLTALLHKKKLRFAPYLFAAVYCILAYMLEGDAFWLTLACLVVFAVNKGCVRFFKEFPVPDAVYTMLSAIGVCCLTRSGDAQFLGYIYACGILISCIFVKRFKKYHIFTSLTFGWIFLMTEGCKPFLCSILICALAAVAIGSGFYIKDKSVRIYGLVLMIFVALKLVLFDFHESEAGFRILVFFVVGLLILGISFLYIYLEKKFNEEEKRRMAEQESAKIQSMELNL